MRGNIAGIDLGTTFSAVGVIDGTRKPIIVPNSNGDMTTPSVVMYGENQEVEVGQHALHSAVSDPERVVQEVKRKMGTDWRKEIDGQEYSPEEISASILRKLMADVEKRHENKIHKALITVPADFTEAERQATKNAGEIAGLDEVKLIDEQVAGFLSEFLEEDVKDGLYFIQDLGGGTTDSSVLRVDGSDIDVVSKVGEGELGGQDFTRRIVEWLEDELGEFEDPRIRQDVFTKAENAKKELSNTEETTINIALGDGLESVTLTRETFEGLIDDLVEKVTENCVKAVNSETSGWGEIKDVLLIGGSSKVPIIQESIKKISGKEPRLSSRPDLAVALGAIIKAANEENISLYNNRGRAIESYFVNDSLSHSLGIESIDLDSGKKVNSIIVEKNADLPAEGEAEFTTEYSHQENIRVVVLEGESKKPQNCEVIGNEDGYKIDGIPPMPQGVPTIVIKMKVNSEGLVTLNARELDSGESLEVEIKREELIGEGEKKKAQKRLQESMEVT